MEAAAVFALNLILDLLWTAPWFTAALHVWFTRFFLQQVQKPKSIYVFSGRGRSVNHYTTELLL